LDRSVKLTSVEFDILETLLRSAGRVVSREQLCKGALDRELSSMDRAVDMHVSRLRKKLGKGTEDEERIKTIRGVGYLYARNGDEGRALLQPETLPAN
jgi:two-component system response regulator CpxR